MCYKRVALLIHGTQHNTTFSDKDYNALQWRHTYGSAVQFDPEKEEWTLYVECLNYYLIDNKVTEDAKKCAILMSGCGPTTYKTIRSLVDSETWKTIKYSELIDLLMSHCNSRPSSIVQQFKFYNAT